MRNAQNTIDWEATTNHAKAMPTYSLEYQIQDILETLPSADAIDLASGSNDGGYYRDELSVFRAELKKRTEKCKCK